jgi:epoxyqueuosine reductase
VTKRPLPDLCLATLSERLAAHQLEVLGGFIPKPEDKMAPDIQRLVLIGPKEPGFWPHLTAQPEWDGAPDPVDRWSRRVVGRLACDLGGKALFPFGGPPYHPFYAWALRTGRVWESPVRLLVHADQGLMVSFRAALGVRQPIDLPPHAARPCDGCAQPCVTACPVAALGSGGYDVPACHAYLERPEGDACLSAGCLVRRACPASIGYARMATQSAYHMRQFHR